MTSAILGTTWKRFLCLSNETNERNLIDLWSHSWPLPLVSARTYLLISSIIVNLSLRCLLNHGHVYVISFYLVISWTNKIKEIMKKRERIAYCVQGGNLLRLIIFSIQADVLSRGENHSSLCSIDNETTNLNRTASFFFFCSVLFDAPYYLYFTHG